MMDSPHTLTIPESTNTYELPMQPVRPAIGNGVIYFMVLVFSAFLISVIGSEISNYACIGVLLGVLGLTYSLLQRRARGSVRTPALLTPTSLSCTPNDLTSPISIQFSTVRGLLRAADNALHIDDEQHSLVVRDKDFIDPNAINIIEAVIERALLTQPKGALDYAELRAQQRLAQTITTRHARATNALLGVITVLFIIELLTGALGNIGKMLMLGANASELVRHGQWWRLVTAGFLHNSIEHFVLNAIALLSVGTILEKLLGHWRFIIIALSASVGGNIASMLMSTHRYSVGASSCIFGLLGALLIVQRARRATLPPALVLPPKRWAYVLGINGLISLLPGIDLSAHVGGFITGAALAALFLRDLDVRAPSAGLALRVLATALIAVFVVSFSIAFGIAFKT